MQPVRTLLPPPISPPLQHGLQRGGVFYADWVPPNYLDALRRTVPTDSPSGEVVGQDIFRQRVSFARPDQPRRITGAAGFGAAQYVRTAAVPMPVQPYHTVAVPHGSEAGGIFGTGPAPVMAFPRVPQRRPMPPMLAGFGGSPDGLGCGGCGCSGSNC